MATALLHFPAVETACPASPYVARVHEAVAHIGTSIHELQHWSIELQQHVLGVEAPRPTIARHVNSSAHVESTDHAVTLARVVQQHTQLLGNLVDVTDQLVKRVKLLEDARRPNAPAASGDVQTTQAVAISPEQPLTFSHRHQTEHRSLLAVWYDYFTHQPRYWSKDGSLSKQKLHEYKATVAFMKIFLPNGYDLREDGADYRARVYDAGTVAETHVRAFMLTHKCTSNAHGTILRWLKKSLRQGLLNDLISAFDARVLSGSAIDSLPHNACIRLKKST